MASGMMMLLVKWLEADTTQTTGMIHTLIMKEEEWEVEDRQEVPILTKTHTVLRITDTTTTTCNLKTTEELITTGDGENKK
jgi:hypothetical protein